MDAAILYLGTIANGTPDVATIAFPNNKESIEIAINVTYSAMSATTGLQATVQESVDGQTFSQIVPIDSVTVTPSNAGTNIVGKGYIEISRLAVGNDVQSVQVTLSNLDATNLATVALFDQAYNL